MVCKDNCLKTVNPKLAKEWHPTKNMDLTPKDVTAGSTKVVWWKCKNGHEWKARIANRSRGKGCPDCPREPKSKTKSLEFVNPTLAKEWHPTKNGTLTPSQIWSSSSRKVWWKCKKGHEWKAVIANRNQGTGCPYCSGRRASQETCLKTLNPNLAPEWHSTKNKGLTPKDVTLKSIKNVWWICSKGHEWKATIAARSKKNKRCPICSVQVATAETCLLTIHPSQSLF